MHLACVVGARPNFMKIAPILSALEAYPKIRTTLVHTGQHYDKNLSDVFFQELGIAPPAVSLGVGSGSHAKQTADILVAFERFLEQTAANDNPVHRVLVVGDVNSTMAASLAAAKLCVPVAHVEAGLRSFDRTMPEEINRVVTDSIADQLFVTEPAGVQNLLNEGHCQEQIHLVGNVMIDTLRQHVAAAQSRPVLREYDLHSQEYGVVTLHRPSNVDHPESLSRLVDVLVTTSHQLPIVFPVHPRTQSRLDQYGLSERLRQAPGLRVLPPLGYGDFLCLTSQAKVVVTDSGGLQEETTALGVPCLTMRANTERPITVESGTSTLLGNDYRKLAECLQQVVQGRYKQGKCPELWDGKAAGRIAAILARETT